jgi:uncharacterized protein (DUF433 family)
MDIAPENHVEIVDGQAMIKGKYVKVKMIASMFVRAGAPIEEIIEQYDLTPAEVHAALAYYYDHQAAIEKDFREGEALARQIGIPAEEHLAQMRARLPKQGTE